MSGIDQLFREKLESHAVPVGPETWDRIEQAQSGNRRRVQVWAAVLAGLVVASYGIYQAVDSRLPAEPSQSVAASPEVLPTPEPVAKPALQEPVAIQAAPAPAAVGKRKEPAAGIQQKDGSETVMESQAVNSIIPDPAPSAESVVIAHSSEVPARGIVIRYTLDPAEESLTASAEPKEAVTGVEKMLDAARDFKDSDPYGRLRQAKDEIFAFNFLNKKNQVNTNEKQQ